MINIFEDMGWKGISLILCTFGFFKEFRPSEPFITDYLTGSWKNFTRSEVNQEIFPVSTYAYFAMLILVFLITDFLRYKPVIVLCGLSGTATYCLIILSKTVLEMQIVEVLYGFFLSSEVAYYTYVYAKVDKKHYQEVTGHTRAAFLLGRCAAGLVAQLTTSFNLLDYHHLNFITLSALIFASFWAFFLPSVKESIYFHRPVGNRNDSTTFSINDSCESSVTQSPISESSLYLQNNTNNQKRSSFTLKLRRAYFLLWKDFLKAYSNVHVVKWSLWWAFATCGYLQVINYIQLLWQEIVQKDQNIFNGGVEAAYTIIGAITVFGVGKLRLNWDLVGEATLSIFSFIEGILLLLAARTGNIWLSYAVYVTFGVIYHTIVTVASFEVAKRLSEDSYSLIFGLNTLLALLLQTILTSAVVSEYTFGPSIRSQFIVYSTYFLALGIIFNIMAVYTILRYCRSGKDIKFWLNETEVLSPTQYESGTRAS
ncbi:thiamine transporter 2-like [Orussus abietinus]|uniref:thiamine transporter 2-like n=1 Tax=Orussus abietinus TaxID=222816 RepID=UPI000626CEDD|nr:thiamine transporter 2-like [Orussus abietinus]XP_012278660.1 thiamine transporter 2-like [Orussus abietinus]